MNDVTIQHEDNGSKGRYFIAIDGAEAEMTYTKVGNTQIIIDHTHVADALRGRHLGEALVLRAVEDARAQGKRIIPLCPFAKAQIEKHVEWQDVL